MQSLRMFKLLEDLEPNESARAVLMKFNGREYVRSREIIRVHEYVGLSGEKGDMGYTFLSSESELWEVASGLMQRVGGYA